MPQQRISFIGGAYAHKSLPISAQQCINWIPEVTDDPLNGTRSDIALLPTPGLREYADLGMSGPIRGLFAFGDDLYAASQNKVFRVGVGNNSAITELGDIDFGTTNIEMADNRSEVIFVDGNSGWTYNVGTSVFSKITDVDFKRADVVQYLDGYFVLNEAGSDRFFISNLFDGRTYTGTDFATAESDSDVLVSLFADKRDLLLFGARTIEIWRNTGDIDFPFQPILSMTIERGCIATHSVARVNREVFWLGDDKVVYKMSGYQLQRVSTHAIESQIDAYADVTDAIASTYTQEGHYFYVLTFPTGNKTWVFDSSTGIWHERSSGVKEERWRAQHHVTINGRHFVGDSETSKIWELDKNKRSDTDDNNPIRRVRATMPISNAENSMIMAELKLTWETGVGTNTGLGMDPQVALSWSDDRGRTFNFEKWRSVGKIGRYESQVIWRRLGKFRDRVFKIVVTDPVQWVLIDASARIEHMVD